MNHKLLGLEAYIIGLAFINPAHSFSSIPFRALLATCHLVPSSRPTDPLSNSGLLNPLLSHSLCLSCFWILDCCPYFICLVTPSLLSISRAMFREVGLPKFLCCRVSFVLLLNLSLSFCTFSCDSLTSIYLPVHTVHFVRTGTRSPYDQWYLVNMEEL